MNDLPQLALFTSDAIFLHFPADSEGRFKMGSLYAGASEERGGVEQDEGALALGF